MRTKELTIICVTVIIITAIICASALYINLASTSNHTSNNSTVNISSNNTTNTTSNSSSTEKSTTTSQTGQSRDTDEDGYIDGRKITYRNKNYLGADSGLEEFSTDEQKYIKQKSTGRIAKRHLDDDGAYRYYDMQTGECVMG